MRIRKFNSIEAWKVWRLGKITGSRLKDIISKSGHKIESYALIAESWIGAAALAEEEENSELAMQRGKRLEPEAIARFAAETGKKAVWHNDDLGWESDIDSRIALSPDASIGVTEAIEAKCLTAKRHIEAFITRKIPTTPTNYNYQKVQYFIANEKLRKLYFVFYHPLFPKGLDYFIIEINRKDIKKEIDEARAYQIEELKWVREQVAELTKYVQIELPPLNERNVAGVVESLQDKVETYGDDEPAEFIIPEDEARKAGLDQVFKGMKERSYD